VKSILITDGPPRHRLSYSSRLEAPSASRSTISSTGWDAAVPEEVVNSALIWIAPSSVSVWVASQTSSGETPEAIATGQVIAEPSAFFRTSVAGTWCQSSASPRR